MRLSDCALFPTRGREIIHSQSFTGGGILWIGRIRSSSPVIGLMDPLSWPYFAFFHVIFLVGRHLSIYKNGLGGVFIYGIKEMNQQYELK